MKVYIYRHAKADFRKGSHNEDPSLTKEGRDDVRNVVTLAGGKFGFKPTAIVSSPVLRAKETADLVKESLRFKGKLLVDESLYGDRAPSDVYALLHKFKKGDSVVLVSHMPLIFELLYDLTGGRGEVELLNGSIAAVECKGPPAPKAGRLVWLIPPPTALR